MQVNKISNITLNSNYKTANSSKNSVQNAIKTNNTINLNNNPNIISAKAQITFKGSISEDLYDYADKNLREEEGPNYAIKNDIAAEFAKFKAQYKLIPEAARNLEDVQCIADYVLSTFGKAGKTVQKTRILDQISQAQAALPPKDKDKAQSEITIGGQKYIAKLSPASPEAEGQLLSMTNTSDGTQINFISSDNSSSIANNFFYLKSITTPEGNCPNYKIYFDDDQQINKVAVDYEHHHDNFYNAQKVYTIKQVYTPDNYGKTKPLSVSLSIDENGYLAAEDTKMVLLTSDARYTTKKSAANPDLKFGQISSFFGKKIMNKAGYMLFYNYNPQQGWQKHVDYNEFKYFE